MTAGAFLAGPGGDPIDPTALVARTVAVTAKELEAARPVARVLGRTLERDGCSVLTLGTAATLQLPDGLGAKGAARDALRLLAAIAHDDVPPLAVGAAPFLPAAPAAFAVPEVTLVARDGLITAVVVGATHDHAPTARFPFGDRAAPELEDVPPPSTFTLTSVHPHDDYRRRVVEALAAIERGELEKVVIAREVSVAAGTPFSIADLTRRLRQLHPGCTTFAMDGFLGASPELLIRRAGCVATSRPLAGTVARSGDPDGDAQLARALFDSDKERAEHAYVVRAISDALTLAGGRVATVGEPHLLELRNVVHLETRLDATFDDPPGALELAAALHPTPAVGGVPTDAALAWLERAEGLDRGRYAGPVGWFDAAGDGEFWLGLRSAMIDGSHARLIAGSGIVAGSDPDAELAETQLKLQALLAAAVRP